MRLQELSKRQAELVQRIAQQRNDIETLAHSLERPISYVDKGYAFMQKVRQQPKTFLIGTLLFAMAFRKPALRISAALLPIATKLLLLKK